MSLIYGQATYERVAQELVFKTIKNKLISEVGIQNSSGIITDYIDSNNIYFENPPHIYINSRSESENNLDNSRFPAIALFTTNQDAQYSMSKVSSVLLESGSGLVKQFIPNMLMYHDVNLALYTLTKYDDRKMSNQLNQFFERYRNGMLIDDDILSGTAFSISETNQSTAVTNKAPFIRSFYLRLVYKIYSEKMTYLMKKFSIKLNTNIDDIEKNIATGRVDDQLIYTPTGTILI